MSAEDESHIGSVISANQIIKGTSINNRVTTSKGNSVINKSEEGSN